MEHFRTSESPQRRDVFETPEEERLVSETREFIDSLDESKLRGILGRELRLAGAQDPGELLDRKFIPFQKVVLDGTQEGTSLGSFSPARGIKINPKSISSSVETDVLFAQSDTIQKLSRLYEQFKRADGEPEPKGLRRFVIPDTISKLKRMLEINAEIKKLRDSRVMNGSLMRSLFLKLQTIHTLVHEELHAISSDDWEVNRQGSIDEGGVSLSTLTTGFSETSLLLRHDPWKVEPSIDERQRRFVGLNEGITELNARRLSKEYVMSQLPDKIFGTDANAFYDLVEIGSYNRERWVAEQFVLLLAIIAEVPVDVVERGLFRAYLNGEGALPGELLDTLKMSIPKLSETEIEQQLLKLQVALSSKSFHEDDTDINRIFIEFSDLLPEEKQNEIKDGFKVLFYKYAFSKELQDEVVGGD